MNKALFTCKNCGEKFFEKDAIKVKQGYSYIISCPKCGSLRPVGTVAWDINNNIEEETKSHNNMCKQLIDEMNPNVEFNVKVKTKPEPKFKVGDKITNGKGIFTIVTLSSDKYIVEDSFGRYGFLHFKNQDEWEFVEEEDLDSKFKAGDRVFNKATRKWVNIIEFDIETGLYIVRYDDGIQGRSLESELCETRPSFKEIKEVVKKKAEVYINSKTELDGLSKSLLYEGFVNGMMTALIKMEE